MSPCDATSPPSRAMGAPVLHLILAGAGESALRLERRLRCAAAGVGVALELELRKDPATLGIPYAESPALLWNGTRPFSGLPRTEEIEAWLRAVAFQPREGSP